MSKLSRVFIALSVLAVAVLTTLGLTYAGAYAEGPISVTLRGVGTAVSAAEHRVAERIRAPEQKESLGWFERVREHRDSLARPSRVLLGAFDSALPATFAGVDRIEGSLQQPMALVHVFAAWGDADEHLFPRRVADAAWSRGSALVVTWEPWLTTFEAELHPHLSPSDARDKGGLAAVTRGEYDGYVRAWARDAAEYGRPLFVRFGHEMNDPYRYPWGPQNNAPADYVAAYRHVVSVFREEGARNVIWVWSPHVAYADYEQFYPGDDVVDWVGATVLNYGTVAYWSKWWSFEEVFGSRYDALASLGKPVMIAELGSLMAGGDRSTWYREALSDLPRRMPKVKAVVFFHSHRDATVTPQALDWSFDDEPPVAAAVRNALRGWPAPDPAYTER